LASAEAVITVDDIPVVALFTLLDKSVTACGQGTVVGASVGFIRIAIITGFHSDLNEGIPTACRLTGGQTGVIVVLIPVIAGFYAFLQESIATSRCKAGVEASIPVVLVAIITFLFSLDDTIAATRHSTGIRTFISRVLVSVIAGLNARKNKPVSTGGFLTVAEARVRINGISIVTLLNTHLNEAVSTRGDHAGAKAEVRVVVVSVIAVFTRLGESISASSWFAGSEAVVFVA
jgi:hypothetical protein